MYTSCVLGLRPSALFNEFLLIKKKKIILVFFDDILVFSSSPESHKEHLKITLDILSTNQLFAKRSKCRFGCTKVEYLGHIINADGVSADPGKIKAMGDWSFPTIIKALRGFWA